MDAVSWGYNLTKWPELCPFNPAHTANPYTAPPPPHPELYIVPLLTRMPRHASTLMPHAGQNPQLCVYGEPITL